MDATAQYQQYNDLLMSGQYDADSREKALNYLADYECWTSYTSHLISFIASNKANIRDFLRLADVQFNQTNNLLECVETCIQYIKFSKCDFETFELHFLDKIISQDDWSTKASFIENTYDSFFQKNDKIKALERLCFIYDKKAHSDEKLATTFDKLISLDPDNIKALKYFKTSNSQSYQWEEVEMILGRLIDSQISDAEKQRYIHELSAVCLYQLDKPKKSLSIIKKHEREGGADLSTIKYDVFQRLQDWDGCRKVLVDLIDKTSNVNEQANLLMRLAELTDQVGQVDKSIKLLTECIRIAPNFYEAYEMKINIALESGDWANLSNYVSEFKGVLDSEALSEKLSKALKRFGL